MKSKALEQLTEALGEPEAKSAPKTLEERLRVLAAVEKQLNKQFSTTTSLVKLGSKVGKPMPSISTGLPTFDYNVSGTGGLPRGRIIEVFGQPSSGKTSLTLNIIAEEQARGNLCAFIDAEHSIDPTYAVTFGVDVDNLTFSQPDSGEQALETAEALIRSQAVSLVVIDSVAAMVPQAELDGDAGSSHMGLQARLMSQACRKLRGICNVNNVTLLFINQVRANIGGYGSPIVTSGGAALKFYASLRLDVGKVSGDEGLIKEGGQIVGHKVRIKAVKNKVGIPFRQTEVDLRYGYGFDKEADLVEYAVSLDIIKQKGAWFYFKDKQFQGKARLKEQLKEDQALLSQVKTEIDSVRNTPVEEAE